MSYFLQHSRYRGRTFGKYVWIVYRKDVWDFIFVCTAEVPGQWRIGDAEKVHGYRIASQFVFYPARHGIDEANLAPRFEPEWFWEKNLKYVQKQHRKAVCRYL